MPRLLRAIWRIAARAGPVPHRRQLPGIDARRAIFARLVDADHRIARRDAVAGAPSRSSRAISFAANQNTATAPVRAK